MTAWYMLDSSCWADQWCRLLTPGSQTPEKRICYIMPAWEPHNLILRLIDLFLLRLFRANETKHWNKLNRLRIPTGRVQTSWLCKGTVQLRVSAGFELRIYRFQARSPNHSAMLLTIIKHYWCSTYFNTRLIQENSVTNLHCWYSIYFTSSLRATNNAERFSAWARWASNLSSNEDSTQNRISESATIEASQLTSAAKCTGQGIRTIHQ